MTPRVTCMTRRTGMTSMTNMNARGQIFSLDFLFSVGVMVLALGFVLLFMDLNAASQKDEMLWLEVKTVGERASNLLVASPDIGCAIDSIAVSNCIDTVGLEANTKGKLGIPDSFGYRLEIEGVASPLGDEIPDAAQNVYSTARYVVLEPSPGEAVKATLYVWRFLA